MPLINEDNLNFSFSGLKTAINHLVKKNSLSSKFIADLSASFQFCVSKILIKKVKKTIKKLSDESVKLNHFQLLAGYLIINIFVIKLKMLFKIKILILYIQPKEMMSDNAAMIAWNCLNKNIKFSSDLYFKANPRLSIK